MTNVPESILTRIAKLLGLAKSDNINEAAAAAAKAQALMDEYRLSEAQVLTDKDPMEEKSIGNPSKNLVTWKLTLAQEIAKANGCYVLVCGGAIQMLGRSSDVAVSSYFLDFLVGEIDRIALKYCKGKGKTYSNNFRVGAVFTIGKKLREDRAAQVTGSDVTALVLDRSKNALAWFEATRYKPKDRKCGKLNLERDALVDGMEAAKEIQLTRGIETTPDSHRLTA